LEHAPVKESFDHSAAHDEPRVNFGTAFRYWFKLGFINFGGPAGQIALMHRDLVEERRWISEERFLHALNFCMLLPGPEAQQLATYIGWLLNGTRGAVAAGFFFVFPSIILLLALSYVYAAYGNLPLVAGALAGVKPVVVAIVVEAVVKIGRRALKRWIHFAIAAAAFVAIYFLRVPFPLIVAAAALIGLLTSEKKEDAATQEQAAVSRARTLKIAAAGLALWLLPLITVVVWRGWGSLHAGVYRFFTQAAFVTFGGAYAVLAYVNQAAVNEYGWMTPAQAVDGLALAETTPGPLIMVLQFVGFMAGWNHAQELNQTTSAVLAALLTTYATFLPSILFILVGAPYVERLRGNQKLSAALAGVTAAVVGVILNLALVFGAAVIWPRGLAGGVDWFAAALSVAAFVALSRFKAEVLWVVLGGALAGLLRAWGGG
jgi:chromate transporter